MKVYDHYIREFTPIMDEGIGTGHFLNQIRYLCAFIYESIWKVTNLNLRFLLRHPAATLSTLALYREIAFSSSFVTKSLARDASCGNKNTLAAFLEKFPAVFSSEDACWDADL
jgi:hypothetical protein